MVNRRYFLIWIIDQQYLQLLQFVEVQSNLNEDIRINEKIDYKLPSPASPKALPIKSAARASPSAAITFA